MASTESTGQSGKYDPKYDVIWAQIRETSRKVEAAEASRSTNNVVAGREVSAPQLGGPFVSQPDMQTPSQYGINPGMIPLTAPQVGHIRDLQNDLPTSPTPAARLPDTNISGFRRPNPPRELQGGHSVDTSTNYGNVSTISVKPDESGAESTTASKPTDFATKINAAAAEFRPSGTLYPVQQVTGILPQTSTNAAAWNGGSIHAPGKIHDSDVHSGIIPPPPPSTPVQQLQSVNNMPPEHNFFFRQMPQHVVRAPFIHNPMAGPQPVGAPSTTVIGPLQHGQLVNPDILRALDGPTGNLRRLNLAPHAAPQSRELSRLLATSGGIKIEDIMRDEFFPFVASPSLGGHQVEWGVIKIMNIPFDAARNEIDAFLGRNCGLVDDKHEPIHIIMDRLTGKTMDAYVEFQTLDAATKAVQRHEENCKAGRPSKIRDREIDVELSSQEKLMKEIFPKAKGVEWMRNVPVFKTYGEGNGGRAHPFASFITNEELTVVSKLVDNPHRCPFSKDAPERPYEFMISTLKKYPWNQTDHITTKDQYLLFKTCFGMVSRLQRRMDRKTDYPARLTVTLMKRFTSAICLCPGFTVHQKTNIADLINMDVQRRRDLGLPNDGLGWMHQYVTGVKMGFPLDLIDWYVKVIRQETFKVLNQMPLLQRQQIEEKGRSTVSKTQWGHFWHLVDYNREQLDSYTLAQCATREFNVIESMLRQAFPSKFALQQYSITAGHEHHA